MLKGSVENQQQQQQRKKAYIKIRVSAENRTIVHRSALSLGHQAN